MLKDLLKPAVTISELASEYGCTKSYVSNVIAGRQKPSPQFKAFCTEKFGVPEEELFPENGGKKNAN